MKLGEIADKLLLVVSKTQKPRSKTDLRNVVPDLTAYFDTASVGMWEVNNNYLAVRELSGR